MIEQIFLLIIFLALSAFFSAAETAFYSINKIKLEQLIKKKLNGALKLQALKAKPNEVLITVLLINNVVNIGAASLATSLALSVFPGNVGIAISTFVMTLIILIFGEITPKALAIKHAEYLALKISGVLYFLVVALSPITWFLNKSTRLMVGNTKTDCLTEDEVKLVVNLGHEDGAIDEDEKEIIHNVFRLNDINVGEVMTPRVEMETISEDESLKNIRSFLRKTPYSKIPVVDDDENVIGIFNTRQVMNYLGKKLDVKISSLMEEPFFVPTSKKIGSLLKEFQEKRIHVAIAVGEYGGVQGLITLEDILEELVGEIVEKKDDEYEIQVLNEKTIIVEGGTELVHVNEELELNLKSKNFTTIAGFILEKTDRFPQKGEVFTIHKIKFEILKCNKNKIELIKISK